MDDRKIKLLAAGAAGALGGVLFYSTLSSTNDEAAKETFVSSFARAGKKPALKVMVSGAAGQIAYSLLPLIANGRVFGDRDIHLRLLDIPPAMTALGGVRMELEDGAYTNLRDVMCTSDAEEALEGVDVAVFVGGFPRRPGMLRKDLISKNVGIFRAQGKALEKVASRNVKVLVVANPANTNCLILKKNAPSIPSENFTCLTFLDFNRARSQIAMKANVRVEDVHNVAIWGNHSATQYPDAMNATVVQSYVKRKVPDAIKDQTWLRGTFVSTIQQRGKAIIDARKLSSAMSAANAIGDHLRTWLVTGTIPGRTVSMGIWSNGNPYGIRDGLIFSFPVHITNGKIEIDSTYEIDEFANVKIRKTENELIEECKDAEDALSRT